MSLYQEQRRAARLATNVYLMVVAIWLASVVALWLQ